MAFIIPAASSASARLFAGLNDRGNRPTRSALDSPIVRDNALVCIDREITDHELT